LKNIKNQLEIIQKLTKKSVRTRNNQHNVMPLLYWSSDDMILHSQKKCSFFRSDSGPVRKKCQKCNFFKHKSWFVPEKRTFFSNKKHFRFQKKNIFNTGPEIVLFSCFCFKSVTFSSESHDWSCKNPSKNRCISLKFFSLNLKFIRLE
jgi:hypothetical protein